MAMRRQLGGPFVWEGDDSGPEEWMAGDLEN